MGTEFLFGVMKKICGHGCTILWMPMLCTLKIVKMATYKYFTTKKKRYMKDLKICLQIDFSLSFFFLFWELRHWQISEFAMGWKEILVWSLFFTEVKNFNFSVLLRVCSKPVIWRESFSSGVACIITSETLEAARCCFRSRSLKPSQGHRSLWGQCRQPLIDSDWWRGSQAQVRRTLPSGSPNSDPASPLEGSGDS